MAAQDDPPAMQSEMPDRPDSSSCPDRSSHPDGPERRAYPRHSVDCSVVVTPLTGLGQMTGKMLDLSQGGCRIETEHPFQGGILVRVEVQFQLRGIAFRIVGVTIGSRASKSFAVRFLDMPARRQSELAEVLEEVAQENAAKAAAAETKPVVRDLVQNLMFVQEDRKAASPTADLVAKPVSRREMLTASSPVLDSPVAGFPPAIAASPTAPSAVPSDRRSHSRLAVDTSAKLLLVKTGIQMPGRIQNLSLGGCRIRTNDRFQVGIYVRVEAEFYLHGLPFRVGGVTQAIIDKHTIGVRFLDLSDRRREQLTELIAEIAEATQAGAQEFPEPPSGTDAASASA